MPSGSVNGPTRKSLQAVHPEEVDPEEGLVRDRASGPSQGKLISTSLEKRGATVALPVEKKDVQVRVVETTSGSLAEACTMG